MIRPILGQLQPKQLGQDREEEASADASVKVNLAGNRSVRGAVVRPCRPRVGHTMPRHSHFGHIQIYAAETRIGCEFLVCVAIFVSLRRSQKDRNRYVQGAVGRNSRPLVGLTMPRHSQVGHTRIYAAETKIGCEFLVCVAILVSQRRSQKDGNRFALRVVLPKRSPQPAIRVAGPGRHVDAQYHSLRIENRFDLGVCVGARAGVRAQRNRK